MNDIKVVIPTYNAGIEFRKVMKALSIQKGISADDIWIIDSSSTDQTTNIAQEFGACIKCISKNDFGHGKTRAMAARMVKSKYIVFMTQDAVLSAKDSIIKLCRGLKEKQNVGMTYGRQLPIFSVGDIGNHVRLFNYPSTSIMKEKKDVSRLGLKTIFCSDSFAAYNREILLSIGNFPDVNFGEDTLIASMLIDAGYSIYYNSEACVYHSHEFSLREEFERYVVIGNLHREYHHIFKRFGKAEGEGMRFIRSEIRYLISQNKYYLLPLAFVHNAAKFLGYRLGKSGIV